MRRTKGPEEGVGLTGFLEEEGDLGDFLGVVAFRLVGVLFEAEEGVVGREEGSEWW